MKIQLNGKGATLKNGFWKMVINQGKILENDFENRAGKISPRINEGGICMKNLIWITLLGFMVFTGCATPPPQKGFDLPPALREIYRGGELKPMQDATSPELGIPMNRGNAESGYVPNNYDLVSHTCTSSPIFNLDGSYWKTVTQCF